jgi:hypothetical protein
MTQRFFLLPTVNFTVDKYAASPASAYLEYYHKQMIKDRTLEHAFYDGSADSFELFCKVALNPSNSFFLVFDRSSQVREPVAHAHLTNWSGFSAMIHFNVLRSHWKVARQVGVETLQMLFNFKRPGGDPVVSTLLGITPFTNRAARKLIHDLGFTPITRIDRACYLFYRRRYVDGVLTKIVKSWIKSDIKTPSLTVLQGQKKAVNHE